MNVKRYVNLGFVVGGLLAWAVFTPFCAWAIEMVYPIWDKPLMGVEFRVSNLLGLVGALGLTTWAWTHDEIYTQAIEIGNELSKVTWPNWTDTKKATIVVVITTLIIAAILGTFDFVWSKVTELIYKLG
jgi:preprotein translocase subunit SecE